MRPIDDVNAATRLARAILADIVLYNKEKLRSGGPPRDVLAGEIQEGRTHFQSRVVERLHPIFDEALLVQWGTDGTASPPDASRIPPSSPATMAGPRTAATPVSAWLFGFILIAVMAAMVWWKTH
jgi:hypothetical protein